MSKWIVLLFLTLSSVAFAQNPKLLAKGQTTVGEACEMTIESWGYQAAEKDWWSLVLYVTTPWQKSGNPALMVQRSATPYSLYGRNKENYDQLGVDLGYGEKTPEKLKSFSFQTWTEEKGLFQAYCRIKTVEVVE